MKKLILLLAFMQIVCISYSQLCWYVQNSGTNSFLFDVCFADSQNGWISGTTGLILHTSDGGANWLEQYPPPNIAYYGLHFTDDQNGWATGFGGAVIHTADGGETWTSQASGSNRFLYDVFFIDENTGWIVGGDHGNYPSFIAHRVILHTTDGGNTWYHQMNNSDENPLMSIHFIDNLTGYAAGEKGTILKTVDGGQTWSSKMDDPFYEFYGLFFIDATHGWAVGQYLGLPHVSVIFRTMDGGESWDLKTFDEDESLSCLYFVNASIGWAGGGSATTCTILKTEDGGDTWNPEDPGTTDAVYGMHFENDVLGWAVGYNGTIITTQLNTGTGEELSVSSFDVFPNPTTGQLSLVLSPEIENKVRLSILNMLGKTVYTSEEIIPGGGTRWQLNLDHLDDGVYFVQVESGTKAESRKFIISR